MEFVRVFIVMILIFNIVLYFHISKKQRLLERKRATSIIKSNIINIRERYQRMKECGAFENNPAFCNEFENFIAICIFFDNYKKVKFSRKTLLNKENLYRQIRLIQTEEAMSNKEVKEFYDDYKEMRMLLLNSYFPYKVKYYQICTFMELVIISFVLIFKHQKKDKEVNRFRNPDSFMTFDMRENKRQMAC